MKKILALALVFVMMMALVVGCGKDEKTETTNTNDTANTGDTTNDTTTVEEAKWADGTYFAIDKEFPESGWKTAVTIEVKDGKIASADWNGVNKNAGLDKKETSKSGAYGMLEKGGAQAEWHDQAALAEAFLLNSQDPTAITYSDEEGHTDAITGVSIHVSDFFKLAEAALAAGPVERGSYKDGAYHAEAAEFANGWKGTVDITVLFGNIQSVSWNAINEADPTLDKKTASADGTYGMVEKGAAQAEWHEQAALVEASLIASQDPTAITYSDEEGHTDAITGVSIHVMEFYKLAEEALASAK